MVLVCLRQTPCKSLTHFGGDPMKHFLSAVALLGVMAVPAMGALWFEDFESYAPGNLVAQNVGWEGWDGAGANAIVSTKFPGTKVVEMFANDDLVHQYSGYTSGQYEYSAMQYIPHDHSGSVTYFIMMNNYNIGGSAPKGWSVQMKFDYATGLVTDDESAEKPGVAIKYGEWKEIKVVIDLEANTQTTYYDGFKVGSADWYNPGDSAQSV